MRTPDEIAAYYAKNTATQAWDFFGHKAGVLLPYLPFELVRPYLNPGVTADEWKQEPLDHAAIERELTEYLDFAWSKALDHRGLSAARSVEKIAAWAWLIGDEELLAYAEDDSHYPNYGAPILAFACIRLGVALPDSDDARRMARGEPCRNDCDEGCGR